MPTPAMPIAGAELARRLSAGLAPRPDGLELAVAEPALVDRPGEPPVGLRLLVTATTTADRRGQVWQVVIPIDPADLHPDVTASALVLILRANLEEWWDRKDHEPHVAAWGRLVR